MSVLDIICEVLINTAIVVGAPNIMVSHDVCFQNISVKLIGKVYLFSGKLPAIQDVFWTKDGEKVDTQGSGGKYSEVAVDDPSLIIYNVNHHDIGSYQLTAINAVGSTKSDVITLGNTIIVLLNSMKYTYFVDYKYFCYRLQ